MLDQVSLPMLDRERSQCIYVEPLSPLSEYDRGGHFPAMEVPDLLVGDVREFFRGLR